MGAAYYQSFVCNLLYTLRCKVQVPAKETKCLQELLGKKFLKCADPNPYYLRYFAEGLVVKGIVKEYVFVMLMPSHAHGVTFGHIEFHLRIGFPLYYTVRSSCRVKQS